jgi:hypothetical protein
VVFLIMAIFPIPTREDLTGVSGELASYSIEADQSWFARHVQRRSDGYVLFKIANHDGRFWSDAVDPRNAHSIFLRHGVLLSFYRPSPRSLALVNGDGEKTYGLTVDGTQVQSPDDAVAHDTVLARHVLPGMAVAMFGLAVYWWRNPRRRIARV